MTWMNERRYNEVQSRGFTPTVVENAIHHGVRTAGNQPGTLTKSDKVE